MLYIGCHMSTTGGYTKMIRTAQKIGANTCAWFTRNPRGSQARKEDPEDTAHALELMKQLSFGPMVAHGAYTMNLCTKDSDDREYAAQLLMEDLQIVSRFPGCFYNFHPGCHVGQGVETGSDYISDALNRALEMDLPVTILMETMAGKGSEIGGSFEQLRSILDRVDSSRVGVCLDTCHVFDAGYDLRQDLDRVLRIFDDVLGLERLKALHLNDSLNPCGSRKDRHAKLGEGNIGMDTFRAIVNHPELQGKPMILETPNDLPGYAAEIALLRNAVNQNLI